MFELYTETTERPLRERSPRSKVVSLVGHVILLTVVIVIPLLQVTNELPPLPTMMAFVAPTAAPPPPPPPPPPPAAAPTRAEPAKPVPQPSNPLAAPLEAPSDVQPERGNLSADATGGVVGGVEGGVPGGVVGGIVGGIVTPAPPPPPPPPAAPRAPVRVGGQITTPALLHRVEPIYPDIAATAHVSGIVILEAVVRTDGCVESVRILRSRHALLDEAAVTALKQWQYTPLVLNGVPTPFVLTVTFTFAVK